MKKNSFQVFVLWMGFFLITFSNSGCSQSSPGAEEAAKTAENQPVINPEAPPKEAPTNPPTTPTSKKNRALVYQGPGACADGCYQAAYQMALQAGLDPTYVKENALTSASSDTDKQTLFKDVAVWIQPGGKSTIAMQAMTSTLTQALTNFVNEGGGYVGFCAGAFSSTRLVGTTQVPGLGFMLGKTTLFKNKWDADILPLTWNGKTRYVYWEGGPYLSEIPAGKAETVATYPNGQIAAARSVYGKGRVFVTGAHPEAPQDWRDYYRLKDPDGVDDAIAVEMINWVKAN